MKKFRLDIDVINKIGKEKLVLIIISVLVLIICTVYEKKAESNTDKTETVVYEESSKATDMDDYIKKMENRLQDILSHIEGIGNVSVMITVQNMNEKNVLMESDVAYEDDTETDSAGGTKKTYTYSEDNQTVYVTDSNGNTYPYVISENSPTIQGVAVVADGGDSPQIKEKIINVIKALFGVEINKISVTS